MLRRIIPALALACASLPAAASVHLWDIDELYSNTDGSVQFIELVNPTASSGENSFAGFDTKLRSTAGGPLNEFDFPNDVVGDTANKRVLIATQGFANLGVVTPDFIVPSAFLFTGGGTVSLHANVVFGTFDSFVHGAIPTDGILSLNRNGSTGTNSPTNFAGATGSVVPLPAAAGLLLAGLAGLGLRTRRR